MTGDPRPIRPSVADLCRHAAEWCERWLPEEGTCTVGVHAASVNGLDVQFYGACGAAEYFRILLAAGVEDTTSGRTYAGEHHGAFVDGARLVVVLPMVPP